MFCFQKRNHQLLTGMFNKFKEEKKKRRNKGQLVVNDHDKRWQSNQKPSEAVELLGEPRTKIDGASLKLYPYFGSEEKNTEAES